MKNNKVYGFIGPIGGGKTYHMNLLKEEAEKQERLFISGDFSDGIRETALNIFGVANKAFLDPGDESYSNWKQSSMEVLFPDCKGFGRLGSFSFEGRDLLKNIGEYLKKKFGKDVWAKWTANDLLDEYYNNISVQEAQNSIIAFGSVRFREEVNAIFQMAEYIDRDVELVFCNSKNCEYDENAHVSERLAHTLVRRGCVEGENVTGIVKTLYNIR